MVKVPIVNKSGNITPHNYCNAEYPFALCMSCNQGSKNVPRSRTSVRWLPYRYYDGNFFVSNPITSKTSPVDIAASAALKAGQ